jgi:uncharacterized membrane protein
MRNLTNRSSLGRIVAALVMGCLALALTELTTVLGPIGLAAFVDPMVKFTVPAVAILTVLIAVLSTSPRIAWGRLCLMNGVMCIALAGVGVQGDQPFWARDPLYERALDQGMRWWLTDAIWRTACYFAVTLIIGAALFALSYWLLHSSHRRHREAH